MSSRTYLQLEKRHYGDEWVGCLECKGEVGANREFWWEGLERSSKTCLEDRIEGKCILQ